MLIALRDGRHPALLGQPTAPSHAAAVGRTGVPPDGRHPPLLGQSTTACRIGAPVAASSPEAATASGAPALPGVPTHAAPLESARSLCSSMSEPATALSLSDDLWLVVLAQLTVTSFADAAAVSCTCRRFAQLVRANALPLVAPLAVAISTARCASDAAFEAEHGPRTAALSAIAAALSLPHIEAAERWACALQRGRCRVSDGSWCAHGLCASVPLGPLPKPGVAALFDAASKGGGGECERTAHVQRALATVLEAVGAPRLALLRWLRLAEPPFGCPRAQLRVGLYYYSGIRALTSGIRDSRNLRAPQPDRGTVARAHAAAGAFGKVVVNVKARDDEAALAGAYLGFMHLDALGVAQCGTAARRCFVAAAQRGSADAADMLRELDAERGWPPHARAPGGAAAVPLALAGSR